MRYFLNIAVNTKKKRKKSWFWFSFFHFSLGTLYWIALVIWIWWHNNFYWKIALWEFLNSKIQKFKFSLILWSTYFSADSINLKFSTWGFLRSLITNPSSEFRDSKSRMQYSGWKCKKLLDWDDIWYSGVSEVANYESKINIWKFKIADPISLTQLQYVTWLEWNLVLGGFGPLIPNPNSAFKNSNTEKSRFHCFCKYYNVTL